MAHAQHVTFAFSALKHPKMLRASRSARASWLRSGVFGIALLTTSTSFATDGFPAELRRHWKLTKPLPVSGMGCKLCHDNDTGGTPPTQPFGRSVFSHGAKAYLNASLDTALDQVKARNIDSDKDGVTDYDELFRDGTNPSDPRSVFIPPPPDAGIGGEGGEPSTGGDEGGQSSVVEHPPYIPPPEDDLPPPFEHGCSTAHPAQGRAFGFVACLALAMAALRRKRQRGHPPRLV